MNAVDILLIVGVTWTVISFAVWCLFDLFKCATTWKLFQSTRDNILGSIFFGGVLTFLIL